MPDTFESNWANTTDVVRQHYGKRTLTTRYGVVTSHNNILQVANYVFSWDDLPSAGEGELEFVIPAYSTPIRAYLEVVEAFAGSDSATASTDFIIVGLQQADGTEIDNDGLIKVGALTEIDARGDVVDHTATGDSGGAPALIGTSIGANDGQLVVQVDDGSLTAGVGRIIVEYLPESVDNK